MRQFLGRKKIILILVVILLIIFLNVFQGPVRNFFYLISEPLQKPLWRARSGINDFFSTIGQSKKLQAENRQLWLKIYELLSENMRLAELERENRALREALEVGLKEEFELIFSQVIGKDILGDTLILNKGAKDGVKENLLVVSQQKVLVGRIGEVYSDFSKVFLVSNKKSVFDGKIVSSPKGNEDSQEDQEKRSLEIFGIVRGGGNLKVSFDLVPPDKKVKEGEFVVTAALGGIFPPGILVGQIKSVQSSDIKPFQQIEIKPAFNITDLNYLFIITEF